MDWAYQSENTFTISLLTWLVLMKVKDSMTATNVAQITGDFLKMEGNQVPGKRTGWQDRIIIWLGNLTIVLASVWFSVGQGLWFTLFVVFASALIFNGIFLISRRRRAARG